MEGKSRIILFSAFALLLSITGWSQNPNWQEIQKSSLYLYGVGNGNTVAEADRDALSDLASKISLTVASSLSTTDVENAKNGNIDSETHTKAIMKTYSNVKIPNSHKLIVKNEPDATVVRWIYAKEKDAIFDARKRKIMDFVQMADRAVEKGKIDDALRGYYWAIMLTQSLPFPDQMTLNDSKGKPALLTTIAEERLNDILEAMECRVTSRDGDKTEVEFSYKEKPVTSVDYTYWDGSDWTPINSATDGTGVLYDVDDIDKVKLKYEYEYRGQAFLDPEVESIMEIMPSHSLKKAYVTVKPKKVPMVPVEEPKIEMAQNEAAEVAEVSVVRDTQEAQNRVKAIARDIQTKNYNPSPEYFTPNGRDIYDRLIKYGKAAIVGQPQLIVAQDGENLMVRGLKMSFSFPRGARRTFVEDMTFTFTPDNKIDNIAFGLDPTSRTTVYSRTAWKPGSREAVLNFLENYKTAFALKRLDYIRDIFDDDAIIITGSVTKRAPRKYGDGHYDLGGDIIRYNRMSKDQYLTKLANTFKSNEFVNIRFSENEIKKLGKGGEVFGIQIEQDYYSSRYGDHGYLFLMVDINDPDSPTIKVRTWQPEKDPEFGLYGPGDF